tara:strand:- start:98 stop:904 length:807 start_codon:yes stop_codon:yes gene_type:complete
MKSASECSAGTYLYGGTGSGNTKDRECKPADKGYKPNSNRNGQQKCPWGEYQDEIGQENCKKISAGYEYVDYLSQRPCPGGRYNPGNFVHCERSDPGYETNDNRTAQVKCEPGTFSNNYGQNCRDCSTIGHNYYQPNFGATRCEKNRDDGYGVNSTHTDKIKCADDEYSNWNVQWKCTKKRTTCPPGKKLRIRNDSLYNNDCDNCKSGEYKEGTNSKTSCDPCPDGEYQDDGGQDKCKPHITEEECTAIGKRFQQGGKTWGSYCWGSL